MVKVGPSARLIPSRSLRRFAFADPHAAFVPVGASGHQEEPHEKELYPDDRRDKGAFDPAGQTAHDEGEPFVSALSGAHLPLLSRRTAHADAVEKHKEAEKKVQDAEKKLKEAKKSGDPHAIAAAEKHLNAAKEERHAASQKERELRQHACTLLHDCSTL